MPQQSLNISQLESMYLGEAAKWGKFLAIVGFIMCGLLAVFSFFAGSIFSAMGNLQGTSMPQATGIMLTVIYLAIAILYFFPCLYLFRFASKMKAALSEANQDSLQSSFLNLKSLFKFMGILTIIVLGFYAIALIAMAIGVTALKM
jgi:hypothetical protein